MGGWITADAAGPEEIILDINKIFFSHSTILPTTLLTNFLKAVKSTAALAVIHAELAYQGSKLLPSNTCERLGESGEIYKVLHAHIHLFLHFSVYEPL